MQKRHNIVLLCFCAVFVCYIDRVNISVAIIPMQEAFGWSDTTKGLVLSSFFVGYMLTQAPSGWLTNRIGGKIVLGAAVLWWSVFTLLTPMAALISLPVLILTRILMGVGEAAMFPAAYGVLGNWIPEKERSRSIGFMVGGIPLGTLFALSTTGWIVERFGWPWAFYSFGLLGIIWTIAWYFRSTDRPADYPGISEQEKSLLSDLVSNDESEKQIPWRTLLTHRAVIVMFINHFSSNWGLYLLLAWLPSYFRDAQGLSLSSAGIYSAAPWLTMFVMANLSGWVADAIKVRGFSLTFVRKVMQCTGLFGSALFFLVAQYADTPLHALALMCGALGFIALTWAGWAPNPIDIAPRYADILMGISNTFATIPGIIGVALAGWLVEQSGGYDSVFILAALVQVFGGILWLMFATAEKIIE